MKTTGTCWKTFVEAKHVPAWQLPDNAAMESFFGTLKSEFFYLNSFDSIESLEAGLVEYIQYYNRSASN